MRNQKRRELIAKSKELIKLLKSLEKEWKEKESICIANALKGEDPMAEGFKRHFSAMNAALRPYLPFARCDTWQDCYRVLINKDVK